jgi:hypothetical protein
MRARNLLPLAPLAVVILGMVGPKLWSLWESRNKQDAPERRVSPPPPLSGKIVEQAKILTNYLIAGVANRPRDEQARNLIRLARLQLLQRDTVGMAVSVDRILKLPLSIEEVVSTAKLLETLGQHPAARRLLAETGQKSPQQLKISSAINGLGLRNVVALQRTLGDSAGAQKTLRAQLDWTLQSEATAVDSFLVTTLINEGLQAELLQRFEPKIARALAARSITLDINNEGGLSLNGAMRLCLLLGQKARVEQQLSALTRLEQVFVLIDIGRDEAQDNTLRTQFVHRLGVVIDDVPLGSEQISEPGKLSLTLTRLALVILREYQEKAMTDRLAQRIPLLEYRRRVLEALARNEPIPTLSNSSLFMLLSNGRGSMRGNFLADPTRNILTLTRLRKRVSVIQALINTTQEDKARSELKKMGGALGSERSPALCVTGFSAMAACYSRLGDRGASRVWLRRAETAISQMSGEQKARLLIPLATAYFQTNDQHSYQLSLASIYQIADSLTDTDNRPDSLFYRLSVEQGMAGDLSGARATAIKIGESGSTYRALIAAVEASTPHWSPDLSQS